MNRSSTRLRNAALIALAAMAGSCGGKTPPAGPQQTRGGEPQPSAPLATVAALPAPVVTVIEVHRACRYVTTPDLQERVARVGDAERPSPEEVIRLQRICAATWRDPLPEELPRSATITWFARHGGELSRVALRNALDDRVRSLGIFLPFAPDEYSIQPGDSLVLRAMANALAAALEGSDEIIVIEGSADPSGDPAANQVLAHLRASALYTELYRLRPDLEWNRVVMRARVVTDSALATIADSIRRTNSERSASFDARVTASQEVRHAGIGMSFEPRALSFAPPQPVELAAETSSSGAPSITVALAEAVWQSAADQLRSFGAEEFAAEYCREETLELFPSTCALVQQAARMELWRLSGSSLKAALQRDVGRALERELVERLVPARGGAEAARVDAVLFLAATLAESLEGESLLRAIAVAPDRLFEIEPMLAQSELLVALDAAGQIASAIPLLRDSILYASGVAVPVREATEAAYRTALVNLGEGARTYLPALRSTARAIERELPRIEAAWARVQAGSADMETTAAVALDAVMSLAVEVVPEDPALAELRDLANRVQQFGRAISTSNLRLAYTEFLLLVHELCPSDCPAAHSRLLLFAVDASTARSQEEMNTAFANLFAAHPDFRRVREVEPEGAFVQVQGFVGGAWSYDEGGVHSPAIHVPLGITIVPKVWPDAAIRSIGIFIPILDLGGVSTLHYLDENGSEVPPPSLLDVVAPGIGITVPLLADFPLSIGATAVRASRAMVEGSEGDTRGAWRLNVLIGIDAPLMDLRSPFGSDEPRTETNGDRE